MEAKLTIWFSFKRKATKITKRKSLAIDSKQQFLMEPMKRAPNLSGMK